MPDTIAIVDEAADGEEALALSTNGRRRRVILMSSYTETYERVAFASGADAFVNKLAIHSGK